MPDFIALTPDKETADAARLIAQVLWDDLAFEREFDIELADGELEVCPGLVMRHRIATHPAIAEHIFDVPLFSGGGPKRS